MSGYGTDEQFSTWLSDRGLTLPAGAPSPAVLRQRGSDYVDAAYSARLQCSTPTGGVTQERAWPRTGGPFADDVIPLAWVQASYRAAYLEAHAPGSLHTTTNPNARVKRQKVDGAVEREFFDNGVATLGSGAGAVVDSLIDGLVGPYLCPLDDGLGLFVRSVGS